ncbi:MARVEL domain-containing protein [Caenorhabditis elegans]|uniref:MARVEL domain-containing protein n=1 Tax=Caenorhabditis elegans TaxID=6239 RepID=Q3S1L6_CAEEL|nr:MARVEL domain-containing protein [Caenorhabditis elegans]CCD70628.2 MARVEL domain-containing protein [Caenorhabditis elegans]
MLPIINPPAQDQSDSTSHNSANYLSLTTNNSNYINRNSESSPQYTGTRNSSLSINYPESKERCNNDLLIPCHLMPPRDPYASRLSTSSAWSSIRLSVLSLSRVFFLKPCSKHKCCLGCISLRDAIPLICTVEIFALVFCATIAIDFWINDGKTFYTDNFQGYGAQIALSYFAFLFLSIAIILFTLSMWKSRRRNWYFIHVIWQWTIIEFFAFFIYIIMTWTKPPRDSQNGILMPSACVLIGVTLFAALVETWWLIIFVDAMLFERSNDLYGSRRASNENREDLESESSNSPTPVRPSIQIKEV